MSRQVEIWKEIKGYEGKYFVSNLGNVANADGNPVRKELSQKGYERVQLYNGKGTRTNKKVHRLVAEAFIPNPHNLPQINHIDENKRNNRVSNLCWVDNRTNNLLRSVRGSAKTPVVAYTKNGKKMASFESVTAASKITGIDRFGIVAACMGNQKTAGGYKWRYDTTQEIQG